MHAYQDSVHSSSSGERPLFDRNKESIVNGKPGKMFVGGLSGSTTVENLKFHFSEFGEIEDTVIMYDTKTKLSRGFGFVTYYDPKCIDKVLAVSPHILDGKKVDPQYAIKNISPARSVHNVYKKLFIGGVHQKTTVEDLKKYFTDYFGPVEDVVLKVDYPKQTHRGFGFLTFLDDNVADRVCEVRHHYIGGKMVETKPAQKKEFINLTPIIRTNLVHSAPAETQDIFGFSDPPADKVAPKTFPGNLFSHSSLTSNQSCAFFKSNENIRKRLTAKYLNRPPPAFR